MYGAVQSLITRDWQRVFGGPEALARILKSLKLDSMERIDNLETLKEIVLKLEEVAAEIKR